ncbi:hypothetical protein HDU80_001089 [Chytriomyces hyalinus]|nr:hypothetical protein HDU80_001089 [Chytriomyces hyalinus]
MQSIRSCAHSIDVSRVAVLSTYRGILRQISQQYSHRNGTMLWHSATVAEYRKHSIDMDPASVAVAQLNALNLLSYLSSRREHKRLIEEYWPASTLTPAEKNTRTANFVGLSMPRPLRDDETKQGGGQTRTEMLQQEKDALKE